MTTVFGPTYASHYDDLYRDKGYQAECDAIEEAFRRYGSGPISTVLDLGCGTGSHAVCLAGRGYRVLGVDRSPEMLRLARAKRDETGPASDTEFVAGDLRSLDLGRRFDAVLMMFAVLGYQLDDAAVAAALASVRRHLTSGGLFVFDVWYGPAVLAERPSPRLKTVPLPDGQLMRSSKGELDEKRRVCSVSFRVWRVVNGTTAEETEETHEMRYFFPDELERSLVGEQLQLLRLTAFPSLDRDADERSWNVLGVARAV